VINYTLEQIEAMAPDSAAAAAAKKLAAANQWPELGQSAEALWGRCQGSSVYQVKIDLASIGYNCSCPSRKLPCKHVLGLLMLAAKSPDSFSQAAVPAWVEEWLLKRRAREEKQAVAESKPARGPSDPKAAQRRAQDRTRLVREGLARLDLWIRDLIRTGIAEVGVKPQSYWEEQAKRLVDSQAPGLAARVARLADMPRSSPDWAERLLGELGRIELLVHAFDRIDDLDQALASEIRQLIGWNVSQDELERDGERVDDTWVIGGRWLDDRDRVVVERSWVVGRATGRVALILQFSAAGQPFPEPIIAGTEEHGTLVFYPGASRQRAKFLGRQSEPLPVRRRPPGHSTIDAFLTSVADLLARQPWLGAFGAVLHDVAIVRARDQWWARDKEARALPLLGQNHWKALALAGGHPSDLIGEWNGHGLRTLGMFVHGRHWAL
jgi:hypothetical protein